MIVWRTALIFFLIMVAIVVFISVALATIQCGSYKRMNEALINRYHEAPKAIGTVNQKRLMEIYVSRAGSWTILITSADGISCIVAAGQDWENVPHNLNNLDPAA